MVARGVALTVTNANAWPAPEDFGILGNNTRLRNRAKISWDFLPGAHHDRCGTYLQLYIK